MEMRFDDTLPLWSREGVSESGCSTPKYTICQIGVKILTLALLYSGFFRHFKWH